MTLSSSTWGALIGVVVAFAILALLSYLLLNTGGANYKVLVAVWLWLLPVTGFFAGIGYTLGKMSEMFVRASSADGDGDAHAKAR